MNGTLPTNKIYNNTPALHISLANPSYPTLLDIISGAKYAGVPHYSSIFYPFIIYLLTPKSHIFIISPYNKILSNFISLCKIL